MTESLGTPADWAEVRAALKGRGRYSYVNINVPVFVLAALLDAAADERDRLAEVDSRCLCSYFVKQPQDAVQVETAEDLAEKRMAELAESRQKLVELESLTSQPMPDYTDRIDKALAALPSMPFDPYMAEAVRILRGEA